MIVNGVTLPDVPAEITENYPNQIIVSIQVDSGTMYYLYATVDGQFALVLSGVVGNDYDAYMQMGAGYKKFGFLSDTDVSVGWAELNSDTMNAAYLPTNSHTFVWANHEIQTIIGIDENGNPIYEETASKPTRYSIATAILDAVARQIMRLTDSTEKVKPEEFEPKLEGINIQLQELTVTATEEVQTITPPSGVYGFSKVIVEAVEDSGGTGGGGTGEGGDGGDTGNDYLDADNVSFGYEEVEVEVPTGNYTYSSGITIPAAPNTYGYHHWWNSGGGRIDMVQSSAPLALHASWNLWYSTAACSMVYYRWKPDTESWDEIGSYTFEKNKSTITIQGYCDVNYTVNYYDKTGVFKTPTTLVAETKKQTVLQPIKTAETYTISGDSLSSIGQAVYKITGTTAANPSEMAEALNAYYLTINPTEGETTE